VSMATPTYDSDVKLYNLTFDANDPPRLATFWSVVLERPIREGANEYFATIARTATAPAMLFIPRVPGTKLAKNRLDIDLDCHDIGDPRDRLEGLGATFMHEKNEFGLHWMTFQDPEGNEFCVAALG